MQDTRALLFSIRSMTGASQLSGVKDNILSLTINFSNPYDYNYTKEKICREFNRKCFLLDSSGYMFSPYNGGLQPVEPSGLF